VRADWNCLIENIADIDLKSKTSVSFARLSQGLSSVKGMRIRKKPDYWISSLNASLNDSVNSFHSGKKSLAKVNIKKHLCSPRPELMTVEVNHIRRGHVKPVAYLESQTR